jgi:PAS domain S-box-containing protein
VTNSSNHRASLDQALLAAIVESSDDGIISIDLSGIIGTWNSGAEKLYGYSASEVLGQPITVLIPSDRADEELGILDRIRRGERIEHYETVRRCKDGALVDGFPGQEPGGTDCWRIEDRARHHAPQARRGTR